MKRNRLSIRTAKCVTFQTTMLSESSQTQKATYCMILFIWNSRKGITTVAETRSGCLGLEWRKGLAYKEVSGNFWGVMQTLFFFFFFFYCGVAYTTVYICQNSLNCTLKMGEFYINFVKLLKISWCGENFKSLFMLLWGWIIARLFSVLLWLVGCLQ